MHRGDDELSGQRREFPANGSDLFVAQDAQQNHRAFVAIAFAPGLHQPGGGGFVVRAVEDERPSLRALDLLEASRPDNVF